MESVKPTRDERIWTICKAEAGMNINDVARNFVIYKIIAYRTIASFWLGWLEIALNQTDQKQTKFIGVTFHSYHIKTGVFL